MTKKKDNKLLVARFLQERSNLIHKNLKLRLKNEKLKEQLSLCGVSGWLFLAKTYPKLENKKYTVLDKYGNIEENVLFGCSGFMNEPYSFFEGKIVKAKDIIAYR